jgi:hypothetical protein
MLRMDAQGRLNSVACNPLLRVSPDLSGMSLIADAVNIAHRALFEIISPCLRSYPERRRLRTIEGGL